MKPVSIQRWDHIGGGVGAWAYESDTGPMVTYADHVTAMEALNDEHLSEMLRVIEVHRDALRQAVESARIEWGMSNGPAFDYARGQRDALAAAVQRVAGS